MIKRSIITRLMHTKILKVEPQTIHFPSNSWIDGTLPSFDNEDTEKAISEAALIIRDTDETVAFPTETVYGLGGSSLNDNAVRNIYKAKNRPSDNPLISHIASIDQLNRTIFNDNRVGEGLDPLRNIPEIYHPLIRKLWPGPLTILLRVPEPTSLSKLTTVNQPTFAVRMPSDPIARALIAISDTPIAAPSANASTRPSPTRAQHVWHDLQGKIPLILDGGACSVGVESTVVDGLCNPPKLLRPGGLTFENIVSLGGEQWAQCQVETHAKKNEQVRTPGMKYKHYSPSARVVLLVPAQNNNNSYYTSNDKILVLQNIIKKESQDSKKIAILTTQQLDQINSKDLSSSNEKAQFIIQSLGTTGEEIQANLFATLRQVDEEDNVDLIFVEGINEDNQGLAVMNRLEKAAGGNCIPF